MNLTRDDALQQLAAGIRRIDGQTAEQLLASDWPGLQGLHPQDLDYFRKHADMPIRDVARACLSRSAASLGDPLDVGGDTPIHLRVSHERKGRWIKQSRAEGMKLSDWIVSRVERDPPTS